MSRIKNQPVLKFIKQFQPNPARTVMSRVGLRVPTHFDSSNENSKDDERENKKYINNFVSLYI